MEAPSGAEDDANHVAETAIPDVIITATIALIRIFFRYSASSRSILCVATGTDNMVLRIRMVQIRDFYLLEYLQGITSTEIS